MSVYRRHKRTDFSVIDNHVFKDKELTLKAKGLLATILSLPDDWKYSIEGLASLCADGTTSVTSALNELISRGYIIRTRSVDDSGRFNGYIYDIYEKPQEPCSENPITDDTFTENQQVLNTNLLNTNSIDNIPLISPEEKLKLFFEEFWAVYPKKSNKKDAFKAFKSIKNIEQLLPTIIADVEAKAQTKDWQKENGQYIPYPGSYLRGERWNDVNEVAEKQAAINEAISDEIDMFN